MLRRLCLLCLCFCLVFTFGCSANQQGESLPSEDGGATAPEGTADTPAPEGEPSAPADLFGERDLDGSYDAARSVAVTLSGDTAVSDSKSVGIQGSTVVLYEAETYVFSGTLEGQIVVNADKDAKVQVVLNGASVSSLAACALCVLSADTVFLTLADGTENALLGGSTAEEMDGSRADGAVFSKSGLTINGAGRLTVQSPAGHGIVSKDTLKITGGTLDVSSASHAVQVNDSVCVTGDTRLNLTAGKDAIHCENTEDGTLGFVYFEEGTLTAEAQGDGVSATSSVHVASGTMELVCGGGSENGTKTSSEQFGGFPGRGPGRPGAEQDSTQQDDATSMKGIKAGTELVISAGSLVINSADDALHSNGTLFVSGGTFELATGDDALHADTSLSVSGGSLTVTESYEGLEAQNLVVSGGEISIISRDDGLNAAGGTDSSGSTGGRDGMFGAPGHAGPGGAMGASDGSVVISGGTLYIQASGDGIDANGSVEISGGEIVVVGPSQGDTSVLDYGTTAVITGGTFFGSGALGMARSFSDSEQGVLAVNVGNQSAGTAVCLQDASGNTLLEHAPALSYSVVILSTPQMVFGESYTVVVGTDTATFAAS